ncbi:LysR family transcriptional regulator [Uruburuella testudinis]|uniref:LysR family transcriptional regulator n=1 Tax=Uruburuella testudinis TaxID=1282863 RepID=A0ABY4DPL4_9NEIS|nr:LysR family transcriptional regulator [Uruburuella testudinis]UOO80990.1 LysR family transcriptional regulator [Uruburuella testudinis]
MINFRLIRHLWLFLAVAEEEHFGRAAAKLGMSQPPLTEQIKQLEHALKVKLFERSRRGTQLTPVGRAVLPAVQQFARQLQQLESAVQEAVTGHSGTLTFGAITVAMLEVLPPLIEEIKRRHPDITVRVREIDSAEAVPLLQAGEIDMAFARLDGYLGADIRSNTLLRTPLAAAVPKSHRLSGKAQISLADLADEAFVMFERKVSPASFDALLATCRQAGFSPRILHEVRSVSLQIAFVGCNQGVALVPASLTQLLPANVVLLPLQEATRITTVAAAWQHTRDNRLIASVLTVLDQQWPKAV